MLRAIADEVEASRWGHVEELLAINVEVTHALYRWMLQVHGEERSPVPKPFRYPRPTDEPEEVEEPEPVTRHTYRRALLGGGMPDGLVGR